MWIFWLLILNANFQSWQSPLVLNFYICYNDECCVFLYAVETCQDLPLCPARKAAVFGVLSFQAHYLLQKMQVALLPKFWLDLTPFLILNMTVFALFDVLHSIYCVLCDLCSSDFFFSIKWHFYIGWHVLTILIMVLPTKRDFSDQPKSSFWCWVWTPASSLVHVCIPKCLSFVISWQFLLISNQTGAPNKEDGESISSVSRPYSHTSSR